MDPEEGFNRYRYKTRVQVVAVIDILVGTIPFINLAFAFNDKTREIDETGKGRELLVLGWTTLLCVYVLQLIMGIWLLAATRECYSEYTVGNCQAWYYIAMFTFVFYIGEMGHAIYGILKPEPPRDQSVKKVILTMLFHATKIIYRAVTLMTVNNFLYDICRPVYKYLSQGSYLYTSYYNYRLGIPPPQRRRRMSSVTTQMIPTKILPPPSSGQHLSRKGMPSGPSAPLGQFSQPVGSFIKSPPIVPPTSAPVAGVFSSNLPVYNSTKIPLQPIPNFNFYFTYPQPKPKQYKSPFDPSVNNNYAYYNTVNSLKQPP